MKRQLFVSAAQSYNCDFAARAISVSNPTGQPFYVRVGGTDAPNQNNASLIVAPATYQIKNISPTRDFGFNLGAAIVPLSSALGSVMVELSDESINEQTTSIDVPHISYQNLVDIQTFFTVTQKNLLTAPAGKSLLVFMVGASTGSLLSSTTSTFELEFYFGGSINNQLAWVEMCFPHPSDYVPFTPFGRNIGNTTISVQFSGSNPGVNTTIVYQLI